MSRIPTFDDYNDRVLSVLIDESGKPTTIFGRKYNNKSILFQNLRDEISHYVRSSFLYLPSLKEKVHNSPVFRKTVRDIVYCLSKETSKVYVAGERHYSSAKIIQDEPVPISRFVDELIFKEVFQWAIDKNTNDLQYPFNIDFIYSKYVHNILHKSYILHTCSDHIVAFINRKDQMIYHKFVEDCGFNLNIDLHYANPLMISPTIIGVLVPENQINFMHVCMPGMIIDTLDADLLKFIGTAIFYEIPADRNDIDSKKTYITRTRYNYIDSPLDWLN